MAKHHKKTRKPFVEVFFEQVRQQLDFLLTEHDFTGPEQQEISPASGMLFPSVTYCRRWQSRSPRTGPRCGGCSRCCWARTAPGCCAASRSRQRGTVGGSRRCSCTCCRGWDTPSSHDGTCRCGEWMPQRACGRQVASRTRLRKRVLLE